MSSKGVHMTEDILNRLEKRYSAGTKLLSTQKDLELLSVAAFLELAGIEFEASQLKSFHPDPPDVIFQPAVSLQQQQESCEFEVTELLDPDTKRNHTMWASHKAVESAITYGSSFKDYVSQRNISLRQKTAITFESLLELIKQRTDRKYNQYEKRQIYMRDIDLIIIIQLKSVYLQPNQNIFCQDEPVIKAWRSISFLM